MSLITIPAYPPAPADIEFTLVSAAGMTRSPFTGKQQTFDWGGGGGSQWLEARVTLPPLADADAQNWYAFLKQLRGPSNTFQFSAAFVAAYVWILQSGSPLTWRLKTGSTALSLNGSNRFFGLTFEVVQVI